MGNQAGKRRHTAANPDDTAAELRLLIREAHEAMSGLRDILREAKALSSMEIDKEVTRAFETHINTQIAEFNRWMEREVERQSGQLSAELIRVRDWMMRNLELISVTETPNGLKAEFGHKEL